MNQVGFLSAAHYPGVQVSIMGRFQLVKYVMEQSTPPVSDHFHTPAPVKMRATVCGAT